MATYYVSGTGSSSNSGLSQLAPKREFRQLPKLQPGDTVLVMDGEYTSPWDYTAVLDLSGVNGTLAQPITIKALEGHNPILRSKPNNNIIRVHNSSHIVIEGLSAQGRALETDYEYAFEHKEEYLTNVRLQENGISVVDSHHISIISCKAQNCAGGGLASIRSDYVIFDGNLITGNCKWSAYGTQGITVLNAEDYPGEYREFRHIIRNNECYDNEEKIVWYTQWSGKNQITDGFGIILDSNLAYTGTYLIEGNKCYRNGAGGIQVLKSNNAVIRNNDCQQNAYTPSLQGLGQISLNRTTNVQLIGNTLRKWKQTAPYISQTQATGVVNQGTIYLPWVNPDAPATT